MATNTTFHQEVHGSSELPAHGPIAHHFDDAEQQHDTAELGMWSFLVTEIMFFGGVIAAFLIYRATYYDGFVAASQEASIPLGTINTMVLLTSSLTMALAVSAAQSRNRSGVVTFLTSTLVLGGIFLLVKVYEYYEKYLHHHIPFPMFGEFVNSTHGGVPFPPGAQMYFVLYFIMTGIHAFHMIIGFGVIGWLIYVTKRSSGPIRTTFVEMTGLYWHLVDIVWIFLFPFLYLIDPLTEAASH